jgi:hypothetical protein
MTRTEHLPYNPPDVDAAHAAWKANCGPCALAALLGRPVMAVRDLFPAYPRRPWCNPTQMKAALGAAGARWRLTSLKFYWPVTGLAFVQFDGPWCSPEVPVAVAYRHTHWVAVRSRNAPGMGTTLPPAVYDANAGAWLTRPEWEAEILPLLLAHVEGSTGWWVRTGIEVPS